jgi:hypothetical protein
MLNGVFVIAFEKDFCGIFSLIFDWNELVRFGIFCSWFYREFIVKSLENLAIFLPALN